MLSPANSPNAEDASARSMAERLEGVKMWRPITIKAWCASLRPEQDHGPDDGIRQDEVDESEDQNPAMHRPNDAAGRGRRQNPG
jgi:hypothetical protein